MARGKKGQKEGTNANFYLSIDTVSRLKKYCKANPWASMSLIVDQAIRFELQRLERIQKEGEAIRKDMDEEMMKQIFESMRYMEVTKAA